MHVYTCTLKYICISHVVSGMVRCVSCYRNKTLMNTSLHLWIQYWVSSWDRDDSPLEKQVECALLHWELRGL